MAITYPSRTLELSVAEVSTIDTYIDLELRDLIYDHCPILKLLVASEYNLPGVGGNAASILSEIGIKSPRVLRQGGPRAELPMEVGTSTNATSFRGGDTLPTTIEEGITRAECYFAYYTTYGGLLRQTMWENSGPGKRLDRVKNVLRLAQRGLSFTLETDLCSTNADVSGTQKGVPGIQNILSTTQTSGTNWGISRSSPNTWWRAGTDATFSFATSGLAKLKAGRAAAGRNGNIDVPNLILSPYTVMGYGITQAEGVHRITNDMGQSKDLSVPHISYMGMVWMSDDNLPASTAYLLNTEYMYVVLQSEAAGWSEEPANPNDQLVGFQRRMATGLTWGVSDPQRFYVLSGISA